MSSRIVRSSAVVTLLSSASLATGFLLQVLLAGLFGAGAATDAYLAAVTIPTLVNTVFLTAMNITFIPVFIEYETKAAPEEAWRVANSFIVIVLIALSALALAGSLMSESLIVLIAPGLAREAATVALAADLQRILLPGMVLMALGGLLASLFYAQQAFVVPTLGPLLANLVALIVAWVLARRVGITGVAIGILIGNAAQVLFLVIGLRTRFRVPRNFAFNHPGVRQIGRLMVPWLLGAIIYKANPVVDRLVASQFSAGAISILGYAGMLAQLAVFVSSKGASLAAFPTMSRLVNSGQHDQLPAIISTGLKLILVAVIPVGVLLLLLGEVVATVGFQRGAFSAADSRLTARALAGYSGSILALSLGNVLTYVYYALQDTRTPAVVGVVGMSLNLGLALLLRHAVGFIAPAISFSIMTLFNLIVLAIILRRRLGRLVTPDFFGFGARIGLAGLVMVAVLLLSRESGALVPAVNRWPPAIQLAYQGGSGLLAYLLCWSLANRALVGWAIQQIAYRMSP